MNRDWSVNMKKIFPYVLIFIIVAGFVYYSYLQTTKQSERKVSAADQKILEIAQSPSELGNFVLTVKQNPSQVVQTNSNLRKMIYSGEYNTDEVENLVNMQRMLFTQDLLDMNPKEFHLIQIQGELEQWKEAKYAIIGADFLPPEYMGEDNNTAIFKVVFYTNDPMRDIYSQYALVKNKFNLWEIRGWLTVDPFEIVK